MHELQPLSVESLTLEPEQPVIHAGEVPSQTPEKDLITAQVELVAQDWAAYRRKMGSNLMRTPGPRADFQESALGDTFERPVLGGCLAPVRAYRLLQIHSRASVVTQRRINQAGRRYWGSSRQGQIDLRDAALLELLPDRSPRLRIARKQHQPRCLTVEAMAR